MDGAEDAEVGSKTSSTTKSAKNLSPSVDMAKNTKFVEDNGGDNKTIKRLPFSKKLNLPTGYLTTLHSKKSTWKTKQSCCQSHVQYLSSCQICKI